MDGRSGDGSWAPQPEESGGPSGTGQPGRGPGYGREPGAGPPQLRPLSLGEILDGMFRLLVRHWRTYLLALGVIVVPVNLLTSYLGYETGGGVGLLEQFNNPAASEALRAGGADVTALLGVFGVGLANALLVTPLVNGIACRIAATGYEGGDPQPAAALKAALRRYGALVGANLLFVLALLLALVPGVVALGLGAADGALGVVVAGLLLLLLGLVGMLALAALFALVYPVVVVERTGPVMALRRSARLVRSRFWPVLGTLLLAYLVAIAVGAVLVLPFSIPGLLVGGATGLVLTTAGSILAGVVSAPVTANAQTLLYYDARVRREGLDLERLAGQLGGPEQGYGAWPEGFGGFPG